MDLCSLFVGSGWTLKAGPPTAVRLLLCAYRLRVISMESVRECWRPRFDRLEVHKFLLLWRFVASVTADADYITAV